MVKIKLNDFSYRYDVYHIFKLFYSFIDIQFVDEDFDFSVTILADKVEILNKKNELYNFKFPQKLKKSNEIKGAIFQYLKNRTGKELPWGVLIGIRPTKIILEMMNEGKSEDEIITIFKENFFVREDKAKLCVDIAKIEKQMVNKDTKTISIYIGMPFCP